jgi:AmmeMemoRadiSam system protein A
MPLSDEARRALLKAAREAIAVHLTGGAYTAPKDPPELREKRGAFVTLRRRADGDLRGCIGLVEARLPLGQTVAEVAVSAAVADPRFPPVTAAELPELTLDVSALSALEPIRPEDVVVGMHGLSIRCAGRAGLLLPQVPIEHEWDRETFLAMTCRKAGLPTGAWKRPDATLLGFTAEVFGEEE